jgi:hypothetical protein
MKLRIPLVVIGLIAAGWSIYQYLEFRSCGERSCTPDASQPVLRLASGVEVPVLSTHPNENRELVINYVTRLDREDKGALCAEAKVVWEEARKNLDTRRMKTAVLSPTSPKSELLGMKYLIVPLYTCCVSTHLRVEKDRSGDWVFPQCPG